MATEDTRDEATNEVYLLLVGLQGEQAWEFKLHQIVGDGIEQLGSVEVAEFETWLDCTTLHSGCINYIRKRRMDSATAEIEGVTVLSFWSVRGEESWTLVTTQEGDEYKWWKWRAEKSLQELGTVLHEIIQLVDEDGVLGISPSVNDCHYSLYKIEESEVTQKATWTASVKLTGVLHSGGTCEHDSFCSVQFELSGRAVVCEYPVGTLSKQYDTQDCDAKTPSYSSSFDAALWSVAHSRCLVIYGLHYHGS